LKIGKSRKEIMYTSVNIGVVILVCIQFLNMLNIILVGVDVVMLLN